MIKKHVLALLVLIAVGNYEAARSMRSPDKISFEQKIRHVYEIPFCKITETGEICKNKLIIIKKQPEDTLAVESYRENENGQWTLLFGKTYRGKLNIPIDGETISLTNVMRPEEIKNQLLKLGPVEYKKIVEEHI